MYVCIDIGVIERPTKFRVSGLGSRVSDFGFRV